MGTRILIITLLSSLKGCCAIIPEHIFLDSQHLTKLYQVTTLLCSIVYIHFTVFSGSIAFSFPRQTVVFIIFSKCMIVFLSTKMFSGLTCFTQKVSCFLALFEIRIGF